MEEPQEEKDEKELAPCCHHCHCSAVEKEDEEEEQETAVAAEVSYPVHLRVFIWGLP